MKRTYPSIYSGLALALLAATQSAQAAPPPGRLLASQCAQCHGTNGQAVSGMDKLAGESESEIYSELMEMKANIKPDEIMHRQAAGFSDAQIRLIARYFASVGRTSSTSTATTTYTSTTTAKTRRSHD